MQVQINDQDRSQDKVCDATELKGTHNSPSTSVALVAPHQGTPCARHSFYQYNVVFQLFIIIHPREPGFQAIGPKPRCMGTTVLEYIIGDGALIVPHPPNGIGFKELGERLLALRCFGFSTFGKNTIHSVYPLQKSNQKFPAQNLNLPPANPNEYIQFQKNTFHMMAMFGLKMKR